jgi:hypothetical protein
VAKDIVLRIGGEGGEVPIGLFYEEKRPTYAEMIHGIKIKNKGSDNPDLESIIDIFSPGN